jgi:hypothetical protein
MDTGIKTTEGNREVHLALPHTQRKYNDDLNVFSLSDGIRDHGDNWRRNIKGMKTNTGKFAIPYNSRRRRERDRPRKRWK